MATFNFAPAFTVDKDMRPRVRKVAFGDGYEQRTPDGLNTKPQIWPLTFPALTNTEAAAIEAFLEARNGAETFDWTPPDQVSALKFVCENWKKTMLNGNVNTITATFRQVFEP